MTLKVMNAEKFTQPQKLECWRLFFEEKAKSILEAVPSSEEIDVQASDEEEMSQSMQLQKMQNVLQQRNRQALYRIEKALQRISKGEFGLCQECGENIPSPRLEALPDADFCISCAEAEELNKKNYS